MIKTVRRRPRFSSPSSAKRGIVYLPRPFIGIKIKVMTESQYKFLMASIKRLKTKMAIIKRISRHEYTGTRFRD
jgi:hypothetical protein